MDPVAHFSVALAASALAGPKASVWVLGAATLVPDLLVVLRRGERVGTRVKAETTKEEIVGLITGAIEGDVAN